MNSSSRRFSRARTPDFTFVPSLLAASIAASLFAPGANAFPTGANVVQGSVGRAAGREPNGPG